MELKDLGLQRINLDLSNNITENFFAKEGDIGTRGLSIKVLNNSVEIDTTGVSITMYARAGQEVYSVDAIVKDALKGEYELIYPTSILKSGIVYAELQLKKLNDIISTKKFKILVESGIVTDSAIEGHDSYPIFEQLLEAGANEITRESNEEIRQLNEIARDDAENLRGVKLTKVEEDLTALKEDYATLVDDVTELSYITQKYTVDSWQKVQDIVRAGLGDKAFRIGDQFVATYAGVEYAWDIIGINHDKPTDKSKNYSLTIQSRDCILNAKIDEPEALYYAEVELPAGDYHFINSYESNKPFHFTLTKAIPVGGIIFISAWSTNTPTQIRIFANKITTTAIETLPLIEGSTGTQLTSINDIRRCQYGSNNYMESAIKPWLNSKSDLFNWESKTKYDRPPIGLPYTGAGFLNLLDSDLVKVIGAVDKQVSRNTVTDGGGQDLFSDKVFLLSRVEVYGGEEGVIAGEVPYEYYSSMEAAPTTAAVDWRIKYLAVSPRYWWLRSPYIGYSYITRFVGTTGNVGSYDAGNSCGVSPACVII